MPRPLWSGSISFGLVNVPIRLYPAVSEHTLHFHLLHATDSSPIGYQKICKAEERPVPDDEIVKAFEIRKGEYVQMTDEDFEHAHADGTRTIDITDFVPYEQIDPIFFARTYYLGPAEGAERVYTLLSRALSDSGLAAVAKFVLRERQHLGALRVRDDVLTLEQLYFADEIRPLDELKPPSGRVDSKELDLARQLIESRTTEWEPERYHDTYRDELRKAIEAKDKGGALRRPPEPEEEAPVDLLDALRASIEASARSRPRAVSNGRGRGRRRRTATRRS